MTAPAWQQYGLAGMNGGQGLVVLRCPGCSALVPKREADAHEDWHRRNQHLPPVDPPGPYIVTELSLHGVTADQVCAARDAGLPHPERTPVGPFPDRQAADDWAYAQTRRYGGGSWSIAPLRSPA